MWTKNVNAAGHTYYKNVDTGETRWDDPNPTSDYTQLPPPPSSSTGVDAGNGWTLYSKDGHPYYYNSVTQESLWSSEWLALYSLQPPPPVPSSPSIPDSHSVSFYSPPSTSNPDSIDLAFQDVLHSKAGEEQLLLEIEHLKNQVDRGVKKIRVKETLLDDVKEVIPEQIRSNLPQAVKSKLGLEDESSDDLSNSDSSDSDSDTTNSGSSDSSSDSSDLEAGDDSSTESDSDDSSSSDSDDDWSPSNPLLKIGKAAVDSLEPLYDSTVDAVVLPFFERIKAAPVITNLSFAIYAFACFIKDFAGRRNSGPSPLVFGGGKGAYDDSTVRGGSREALRRRGQKPLPMPKMPGRFGGEEKKLEQPQAWVYEKDN
mmetsp:Transcript_16361/g.30586  ORF Transcript_16361/g.30586 Transcript_16361/m.30586 type:complete len:370 (+) Transcript_16361:602-1711(+)|eukprot:CAMPEP_0182515058 /NCGR_PEP_ID=MMETSP1321-20130603/37284_1 /TAXON_ID=91990 /ORGANISM="Bolidomonas sp., Strain RCC1657" /LENGTH=369 /DNA_ID=CAMNT_0024722407 /DNA_START=546 /DNA_END=1655 /DNA_ORIENTATION=+